MDRLPNIIKLLCLQLIANQNYQAFWESGFVKPAACGVRFLSTKRSTAAWNGIIHSNAVFSILHTNTFCGPIAIENKGQRKHGYLIFSPSFWLCHVHCFRAKLENTFIFPHTRMSAHGRPISPKWRLEPIFLKKWRLQTFRIQLSSDFNTPLFCQTRT